MRWIRKTIGCSPEPPENAASRVRSSSGQHLALVLEQYRRHPKPRRAGIVRGLTERGDERELFAGGR